MAVRPRPAPQGLPPCFAAAAYDGEVRQAVLAYKERGLRRLAAPLGDALAAAVDAGLPGLHRTVPLALVPVPATAAAIRARHGDHMLRLARRAAARLRRDGWANVELLTPLRALPRPDSAKLDRQARSELARSAFVLRPGVAGGLPARCRDAVVVALDDVLTTGATLAAVARLLAAAGAPVAFAATVAATRLRAGPVAWQPRRDEPERAADTAGIRPGQVRRWG